MPLRHRYVLCGILALLAGCTTASADADVPLRSFRIEGARASSVHSTRSAVQPVRREEVPLRSFHQQGAATSMAAVSSSSSAGSTRSVLAASSAALPPSPVGGSKPVYLGTEDDWWWYDGANGGGATAAAGGSGSLVFSRQHCPRSRSLLAIVDDSALTTGEIGWVFPGLINGDCPISASILRVSDDGSPFGSMEF